MLALLSLLLITHGASSSVRCSAIPNDESTDMLSLLDFKRAITKDPRRALRSWNASIPYCQWEGVRCSLSYPGRVTDLSMVGLGLAGTMSPSLGNLTFLETLDLTNNSFTGELPPLSRLHRLQGLSLGINSLQGMIPDTLANCSNLQWLYLSSNFLIGFLSNLHALGLGDNHLTGSIPDGIGQLQNLRRLILGGNRRLSGRVSPSVLNLTYLEVLDLRNNMLAGALPSNIGDMFPYLTTLELDYNKFEGHIPASLGNISELQILGLSFNNFIGQLP